MKYARVADRDAEVADYIDKNKFYRVHDLTGTGFHIGSDQFSEEYINHDTFCLIDTCSHLRGGVPGNYLKNYLKLKLNQWRKENE